MTECGQLKLDEQINRSTDTVYLWFYDKCNYDNWLWDNWELGKIYFHNKFFSVTIIPPPENIISEGEKWRESSQGRETFIQNSTTSRPLIKVI